MAAAAQDEEDCSGTLFRTKSCSRRRRRLPKSQRTTRRRQALNSTTMIFSLILVLLLKDGQMQKASQRKSFGTFFRALALVPKSRQQRHPLQISESNTRKASFLQASKSSETADSSPLFTTRIRTSKNIDWGASETRIRTETSAQRRIQHRNARPFLSPRTSFVSSASSPTALHMVLTTPESIIEQASTVNLLDDLINESVRTSARRPIMMQFDPSSGWIWRRWKGTVFAETWISCARNMLFAAAIFLIHRTYPTIFQTYLSGFQSLWGQLLSVTTFTLTFFVNQSYALWRKCMELSRRLQGRLHDVNMNMASHAARVIPSNPNEKSTYTVSSRQILELMSRYTRLFNLLTYASFTRSHRPILTPRGLRRLVERGLMTAQEREVLVDAVIPATQRHSVVLMWMIRLFVEGRASGHIQGGHGFESETMHKFHIIRSQYGAIGDELQGRMPLAYAHIVQVLVDLILWMFPIMAFSTGMSPLLVIFGTGLLTMSYQGLFDLAKQFLDPYDNENYGRGEDPLCVDTLIAETNAGSIRWLYGFEELPFSAQRLNDGELYEYLLPVRGYSVEELEQMEKEQLEREKQLEEQRKREDEEAAAAEAERLRREAEEQLTMEADDEVATLVADVDDVEIVEMERTIKEDKMEISSAQINEAVATPSEDAQYLDADNVTSVETLLSEDEQDASLATESSSNITQSDNNDVADLPSDPDATATTTTSDGPTKETRPVNKVTTLASDGSLISSFTPSKPDKPVVEEPVPSGMQTSNYLATLRMQNEKIKSLLNAVDNIDEETLEEELIDFEAFEDLPWLDEIGSDGQEFRLSQQLADEVWLEEDTDDVQIKNMTKEEYEERLKEIEEDAENELKETIEIMSAIPGVETDIYTVTERKKKKAPTYDQTRLDGISQLWGLPPEDPSSLREYEPPEKIDEMDFSSISQLWGGSIGPDSSGTSSNTNVRQDEAELVGMEDFSGISELWGSSLNDFRDDTLLGNETDGNEGTEDGEAFPSFAGLPWHDERGADGKEYRLSQLLADEEWDIESDSTDETSPMTLEDYNKEVEKIITQAEEELRETEAILLSKPGTDPVGWDYEDDQLTPMSNETNSENDEEAESVNDEDLAVLEMDVDVNDDINNAILSIDEDGEVDLEVERHPIEDESSLVDEERALEDDNQGYEALLNDESDHVVMADDDRNDDASSTDRTDDVTEDNHDEDDETTGNGKNKIEPIFLKDEGENPIIEDEDINSTSEDGDEEDDLRL